jgi:hypothetical protein
MTQAWKPTLMVGMSAAVLLAGAAFARPARHHAPAAPTPIVIDLSDPKPANSFIPGETFGGAVDGMQQGEVLRRLTPFNVKKMRQAGLQRVTYRTRPELGIEAWHWTEEGTWSDPTRQQGYWTGSDNPKKPVDVTWGYNLPRRGMTIDNANNEGYSRLDDGDPETFWKTNPYLDKRYTGLPENRPQWFSIDFEKKVQVNAARVLWGTPWPLKYKVQYWTGKDQYDLKGVWVDFEHADYAIEGKPDDKLLRLAETPVATSAVRFTLLQSSETAPEGSTDIRDRLGYAVREVYVGLQGADGAFHDEIVHGTAREKQTDMKVSSTDPWHRAIDKDTDTEQAGLDLIFRRGLSEKPIMVPVGVFFDTPENAAAEIRYLKNRRFPVSQVELGEEADGQFIAPEDYADLYLETAAVIRKIAPELQLGGPSSQGALTSTWPATDEGWSWTKRFLARLKARGGLDQLNFFSFEYYPWDDQCGRMDEKLRENSPYMQKVVDEIRGGGLPETTPLIISEYGLSPFSGAAMSKLDGALFDMDTVGEFLTLGGEASFMFGYPPSDPINQLNVCSGYGDMMLYDSDAKAQARNPMPAFFAHYLMTHDWATQADARHRLYRASVDLKDEKGRPWVTAYPLLRPDGSWSVMIVNRDSRRSHPVRIVFRKDGQDTALGAGGEVAVAQYSTRQYRYLNAGEQSRPVKDLPPVRSRAKGGRTIVLPATSLTIVEGAGPKPS